jgi:hypothetical protein
VPSRLLAACLQLPAALTGVHFLVTHFGLLELMCHTPVLICVLYIFLLRGWPLPTSRGKHGHVLAQHALGRLLLLLRLYHVLRAVIVCVSLV